MFICKQTKLKGGIFIEDIKRNQDNFIIKDFKINDYIYIIMKLMNIYI